MLCIYIYILKTGQANNVWATDAEATEQLLLKIVPLLAICLSFAITSQCLCVKTINRSVCQSSATDRTSHHIPFICGISCLAANARYCRFTVCAS